MFRKPTNHLSKKYTVPKKRTAKLILKKNQELHYLSNQNIEQDYEEQDNSNYLLAETIEEEEILRLEQKEIEMIKKSLEKNKGKRKAAADELGISERTLYRKIKQFDL